MPEFSSSKIISHFFCIDNNSGESVIGCDMIIVRDLMVQLCLLDDFNHQVLYWDGAKVTMKKTQKLVRENISN